MTDQTTQGGPEAASADARLIASALQDLAGAVRLLANSHDHHGSSLVRAALSGAIARRNPPAPDGAKNPERWSYGARVAAVVTGVEEGLDWADAKAREHSAEKEDAKSNPASGEAAPAQENARDAY